LQIREGLFNEDELRELEQGFSVSETSNSEDDDINSSLPSSRGLNSLYLGGVQSAAPGRARLSMGGVHDPVEAKVRFEQHKLALEGEVSQVKSRYMKKLS